ncbi:MAG: hypothetical protein WCI27_08705, partial [Candidatus Omnitrophota bacterium]
KALMERVGFSTVAMYQKPGPIWYPNSLIDCFNQHKAIQSLLIKIPRFMLMLFFTPVVLWGCLFNLSDNLTIQVKKQR